MNKKVFALLCCVCTSFMLLSCSDDEGGKGNDAKAELVKIPLSSAETEYSQQTNRFALNLFGSVYNDADENDKNVALSPLSVAYVLGMLNQGADGQTKAEIMEQCPDISKITVECALKDMMDSGEVLKIGGGRYTKYVWNRGK